MEQPAAEGVAGGGGAALQHEVAQHLGGGAAGDLSSGGAAHAVADGEGGPSGGRDDEEAVLVAIPLEAGIAAGGDLQVDRLPALGSAGFRGNEGVRGQKRVA